MCGRYAARTLENFEGLSGVEILPRFNIPPGQTKGTPPTYAIRISVSGERELVPMQWWLLPSWSKTRTIQYTTFNAAIEGIETKASFREPLKNRRCLILADGFYEWHRENRLNPKQPYFIHRKDDGPFCFAGLWDRWRSKDTDEVVESCTIITTPANELLNRIHHRSPVILLPEHHGEWLDKAVSDVERLKRMLHPFDPRPFEMFEVSRFVNNSRNEGPQCIEPLNR